jgi:hypothetical protein
MRAPATKHDVLVRYPKVAVIGAGVIGASWTALFLAHGLTVVVNDPRADVEDIVKDYIRKATPTLKALGIPTQNLTKRLRFEPDLDRAVADVDLVQENGPERIEFKQDLWARIDDKVSAHTLLLSSSSARTATEQSAKMTKSASRLLIGHPFNPPHLIPLVEVVPGGRPSVRHFAVCKHSDGTLPASGNRQGRSRRDVAAGQWSLVEWLHGAGCIVWRQVYRSATARAGAECVDQLLSLL